MRDLMIGDVARRAGFATSAIRYYENAGLLPKARKVSGKRRYDAEILGRVAMIRVAREAGFSIAETKAFLTGFTSGTKPSARWQALASRKLVQIDDEIARAQRMKALLQSSFRCGCPEIDDCARAMTRKTCSG